MKRFLTYFLTREESSIFIVRNILNPRETKKMLDREHIDEEMQKGWSSRGRNIFLSTGTEGRV